MKTFNIKTYRTVIFELNHCVEAEDERSAMVKCINWYDPSKELTVDDFKEWIDPQEDYKSIQFCYVEKEEEDA